MVYVKTHQYTSTCPGPGRSSVLRLALLVFSKFVSRHGLQKQRRVFGVLPTESHAGRLPAPITTVKL